MTHVLDGATLWPGDGRSFDGHVVVEGDRIAAVESGRYLGPLPRVDLAGAFLSPGLIDLMVLGGFDRSILRDDPLEIARQYLRLGVTACQFCAASLPWDAMCRIAGKVRHAMDISGGMGKRTRLPMAEHHQDSARVSSAEYDSAYPCHPAGTATDTARVLGLYLEGPFQDPERTGASMRDFAVPPTRDNVERVLKSAGNALTMINVSPGVDGDVDAIRRLRAAGKIVSMAHSNASAERVLACVDAGTSVLGHVWNNNSGRIGDSGVQQPTIEHVALLDERVRFIHLICDGAHVDPLLVRLVCRCRGVESVCLVTDAVVRAGCPDGPFEWDDGRPFVKAGGVGRTNEGWLCGSALLLPDHFRNFVKFTGIPPERAIQTVTFNPASSLGLDSELGLLAPGRAADLVAWDADLNVRRVWRGGSEIADVSSYREVAAQ